jgi:hypothetical protein
MTDQPRHDFDGPAWDFLRFTLGESPYAKHKAPTYTPGEREADAEVRPRQRPLQVLGQIAADRDETYNNALTRDFRNLYENLTRMERRPPSRLSPVRVPAYSLPMGQYFEFRNAFRHGGQALPGDHDPDLLPGPR